MRKQLLKSLLFSLAILLTLGTSAVLADAEKAVSSAEQAVTVLVEDEVSEEVVNKVSDEANSADSENAIEISIEEYEENVTDFNKISISELHLDFTEDGLEHTIYFGRGTCYYCRQFSPELREFNQLIDGKLEYYDTSGEDFDESAREFVFQTLGIPGTPTILHIKNGQVVSGWVGGGVTAQNLYNFIYQSQSVEEPEVVAQESESEILEPESSQENVPNSEQESQSSTAEDGKTNSKNPSQKSKKVKKNSKNNKNNKSSKTISKSLKKNKKR